MNRLALPPSMVIVFLLLAENGVVGFNAISLPIRNKGQNRLKRGKAK